MPQALSPHQGARPVAGGSDQAVMPHAGRGGLAAGAVGGRKWPLQGQWEGGSGRGHCPGGVPTPPPHSAHGLRVQEPSGSNSAAAP